MARRKKNDLGEDFYGLFMAIPAWVSIPVAIVAFFLVRFIAAAILRSNPVTVAFVPVASMLSYLAPIVVLASGLRAALNKIKCRNLLAVHWRRNARESRPYPGLISRN